MASNSVKDYIAYYKNKLERIKDNEEMILETLHKLGKPPTVTADIIQETDILRVLHKLCRRKGLVGDTALPLYNKWKLLMTIAISEKEKRTSPAEEKPNHSLAKPQGEPQARSSRPSAEKDPASHPPHRSRDTHPDRGIKRTDPFPLAAEPKRPLHQSHRERRHTPQKDYPPPDTKSHQIPPATKSANPSHLPLPESLRSGGNPSHLPLPEPLRSVGNPSHVPLPESLRSGGNPSHHRSSDSDSDRGSRHQPSKRDYLTEGNPRHVKKEPVEAMSHYPVYSAKRNPKWDPEATSHFQEELVHRNPNRDSAAASHYLEDSGRGGSNKVKREQGEAMSHHTGDSTHSNPRNPKRDSEVTSHYLADAVHDNPRNIKRDPEATSHWESESDSDRGSRQQTIKKEYQADSAHGNPRYIKKEMGPLTHWGKDFKSRKDPETDSSLSLKKDYHADSTHGHPMKIKKEPEEMPHWGSNYKSRKDVPATESDSILPTKKEYLSDGNLRIPKKEPEAKTYREYKARKELGESSAQRDLFPMMEGDSADESNRDSDSRYPPPKKDYFSVEADTTCPGSRSSEHNGVSNSQDGTNHMDIDSLSNPNLNIETAQADKLNTSDESEPVTPTKRAKTLEPYYIEMREGMFRAVKTKSGPFSGVGGLKYCELIHRDITKGNSIYKRDYTKFDEPKKYDPSPPSFPSPTSDGEKPFSKNGPLDKKSGRARDPGSAEKSRHDIKIKSESPCKDRKSTRPDSTSDHKLKVKKEVLSPSQLSKPLNNVEAHQSNCDRNKKLLDSPEGASMQYISSKKDRRAVYSGRKAAQDMSSLKGSCLRVLRKNLDYLRCPTKVPYETLHPILETLNPSQLSKIEEHNKHLMAYTNGLWKQHYNRDCRGQMITKTEKDVIWKDEYNRVQEQQKKRLKSITASITASASKAKPDRQAKVVDSHHDFGGRRGTRASEVTTPSSKCAAPSVTPAVAARLSSSPTPKASSSSIARTALPVISKPKEIKHSSAHKPVKKVVAPLMSKVKKSMATVYNRQK